MRQQNHRLVRRDRGHNRNDFSQEKNKSQSKYKLQLRFTDDAVAKYGWAEKKNYFSFNYIADRMAYDRLKGLVRKYEQYLVSAEIWDNQNDDPDAKPLEAWYFKRGKSVN